MSVVAVTTAWARVATDTGRPESSTSAQPLWPAAGRPGRLLLRGWRHEPVLRPEVVVDGVLVDTGLSADLASRGGIYARRREQSLTHLQQPQAWSELRSSLGLCLGAPVPDRTWHRRAGVHPWVLSFLRAKDASGMEVERCREIALGCMLFGVDKGHPSCFSTVRLLTCGVGGRCRAPRGRVRDRGVRSAGVRRFGKDRGILLSRRRGHRGRRHARSLRGSTMP